jgi:hypothetical protein
MSTPTTTPEDGWKRLAAAVEYGHAPRSDQTIRRYMLITEAGEVHYRGISREEDERMAAAREVAPDAQ